MRFASIPVAPFVPSMLRPLHLLLYGNSNSMNIPPDEAHMHHNKNAHCHQVLSGLCVIPIVKRKHFVRGCYMPRGCYSQSFLFDCLQDTEPLTARVNPLTLAKGSSGTQFLWPILSCQTILFAAIETFGFLFIEVTLIFVWNMGVNLSWCIYISAGVEFCLQCKLRLLFASNCHRLPPTRWSRVVN